MISTLEIARRLGITSVAVNNRIKKLEIEKIRRGVFAYVTEDDFERIAKLPLEPSEQTTSISTNTNSFTKFPPVDPLISENRALRQQLNDLQQEIQQKDLQQQEQLRNAANRCRTRTIHCPPSTAGKGKIAARSKT